MAKPKTNVRSNVSDSEYQHFAEKFTDMILDPKRSWLIEYLLARGFDRVPTWEELKSEDFAFAVRDRLRGDSWLWETSFFEALRSRDREQLVPNFKESAVKGGLTHDHLERLLAVGNTATIKDSLRKFGGRFTTQRGPKARLPVWRYSELLTIADLLRPAIQKLLGLLENTSRTVPETLQFLQKDYPAACEFLLQRTSTLQQALVDPKLLRRAKKVASRARVLADAMAGTDHEFTFSTSIERVREARRQRRKQS